MEQDENYIPAILELYYFCIWMFSFGSRFFFILFVLLYHPDSE